MKKHVRLIVLGITLVSGIFIGIKAFSSIVVPAYGCKYTGNKSDYCVFGEMRITNCCNTLDKTTCGINIAPPVSNE